MLSLCPYQDSVFQISNNKILKCQTAGIYIEGPGCSPEIIGNEVKYCNSVGTFNLKFLDHVCYCSFHLYRTFSRTFECQSAL